VRQNTCLCVCVCVSVSACVSKFSDREEGGIDGVQLGAVVVLLCVPFQSLLVRTKHVKNTTKRKNQTCRKRDRDVPVLFGVWS